MKTTITILLFVLMNQFAFSQSGLRKTLHGQVINDSIKVENVIIFNINAKAGAVTKSKGYFDIMVREHDTLLLSSLLFKSKKVVITKEIFNGDFLKISLKTFSNELDEVVVTSNKINKPISGNTQNIVDKKYFDDAKSSPKNSTMPNYNVTENGVNFVRLYKDILKILRKKDPKKNDFTSNVSFTEVVMNKVNYPFFSNTLKLEDDEIKLFLVFSENDPKANTLTKTSTDFEIMDYLIGKNNEFKKITSETNPQKK